MYTAFCTTLADSPFSPAATKAHTICSTYGATQTSGSLPAITSNVICGLHGVAMGLGQQEERIMPSYLFCFKIDLYTEDINTPLMLSRRSEAQTHLKKSLGRELQPDHVHNIPFLCYLNYHFCALIAKVWPSPLNNNRHMFCTTTVLLKVAPKDSLKFSKPGCLRE